MPFWPPMPVVQQFENILFQSIQSLKWKEKKNEDEKKISQQNLKNWIKYTFKLDK